MNTKNRRRQVYEGKAKILFEGNEKNTLIQYFKDDATAFNNKKKGTITGKGVINNAISAHIFNLLNLFATYLACNIASSDFLVAILIFIYT